MGLMQPCNSDLADLWSSIEPSWEADVDFWSGSVAGSSTSAPILRTEFNAPDGMNEHTDPFDRAGSFAQNPGLSLPSTVTPPPQFYGNYLDYSRHYHSYRKVICPDPVPNSTWDLYQEINEVMLSDCVSSPTKVDVGQNLLAQKRRRRESHNLVERRRRDNINERIHDLSRLVPQCRLEDEKVRKHISSNAPLPSTKVSTDASSPPSMSWPSDFNEVRRVY